MNLLSPPLHFRGKEFYGISVLRQSGAKRTRGKKRARELKGERERGNGEEQRFGVLRVKEKPG